MILVTQSFGRVSEYRRVVLAVLSYYAYATDKDTQTLLFTDQPEWFAPYFKDLPVSYVLLTPEKIKLMRGNIDFLHRMKIALIEEAFQSKQEDVIYIDSDTFFIADPGIYTRQIAAGNSFMHVWEYQFEALRNLPLPAGATFQAFVRLIERNTFQTSKGELSVNAQMSSWNAGVMMLHKSHAAFLPDVYALTDQFYPETQNHASEQYAFSILLQTNTTLAPCDAVIYHYWYNVKKKIIDEYLGSQFEKMLALDSLQSRLVYINKMTKELPNIFEHHTYALKDNAIQAFNDNKFWKGYQWAFKAIFAGAVTDTVFVKDILYHIKRHVTK